VWGSVLFGSLVSVHGFRNDEATVASGPMGNVFLIEDSASIYHNPSALTLLATRLCGI